MSKIDMREEFNRKLIVEKEDLVMLPPGTVLVSLLDGGFWKIWPGHIVSIYDESELYLIDGDTRVGADSYLPEGFFYTMGPFEVVGIQLSKR